MADSKLTALTTDTTPTSDDLTYVVNDPAGTPGSKKVTLANAVTKAHGLSDGAVVSVVSGIMSTTAVTPSAAELNILDGATLSTTELNYVHGVTSDIQSQLNAKGNAQTANPLSQFASTTSLQLKGVISDETGSGALVFGTSPTITTPTGIVKGDVGLGNVDNTSDATKNSAVATLTNKDLTSGTNTFPTFNQNTTGSAAKLTTARNINGVAFDGTSDITTTATTTGSLGITIDGAGSVITTGFKESFQIPYDCTITGWTIAEVSRTGPISGSIVFDIWKDTYANYPPAVADTITASAKPTVTTATKATSTTLTGWTTTLTKGDWIAFNVDSVTSMKKVFIALAVSRTI